jgi:hypothetical protein
VDDHRVLVPEHQEFGILGHYGFWVARSRIRPRWPLARCCPTLDETSGSTLRWVAWISGQLALVYALEEARLVEAPSNTEQHAVQRSTQIYEHGW